MLVAEVHNPTGLKLTKSDMDGIFLHFAEAEDKQAGIRLDNSELICSSAAIRWAEKQFSRKDVQVDLLEACKKVQQYNKAAQENRLNPDDAHEYWDSVMSYVDLAVENAKFI